MIDNRILALLSLLVLGCSQPTEPVSQPTEPVSPPAAPDQGSVALTVSVSGDPTLFQSLFSVRFNGIDWSNIQPNEPVRVPLKAGDYAVQLSSLRGIEWCSVVEPTTIDIRVEAGKTQSVQFTVDCPPLVGTATLRVVADVSGAKIPAEFGFSMNRVIGPRVARAATVRPNDSTDVTVPVGVYQVVLPNQSNCSVAGSVFVFGFTIARTLVLRASEATRTRYAITCRATP